MQTHFAALQKDKVQTKSQEIENLSIFNETLEQNATKAEFRQVQLEGELKTSKDQHSRASEDLKDLQQDHNTLQD